MADEGQDLIVGRVDFLAGQLFDIRLEIHAPVNGSEANGGIPDPNFKFTVAKKGGSPQSASSFFKVVEPALEFWNFTFHEGRYTCGDHVASCI